MSELKRILIVDDEENCLRALKDVFDLEGLDCLTTNNVTKALELLTHNEIDIVIADVRMPVISGTDLLRQIKRIRPETFVIMLTGFGSINDAVASIKLGAYQYIMKPVIMEDILTQIKDILSRIDAKAKYSQKDLSEKIPEGKNILGNSVRIQNVVKLIDKIANTDLPVLILGESGAGKELAATTIHYSSNRAKNPFISVNCAAFPDALFESELFGYEKGAFPDARASKAGKIEQADGGTLFFDEIGDMKPVMQTKLLRVLEEQEFQRLGSNKTRKVDVRIISATNRDLRQSISEKTFRSDLYYRLNAVSLFMPPLREIPDDIPILANHFAKEFAARFGRKATRVSSEALPALTKYQWPGNVRELSNAIRRAVALSDGNDIRLFDLPPHLSLEEEIPIGLENDKSKSLLLEDIEKEHILKVLDFASSNKSEAAQILGIHRDTLLRKLKKYGVE